MSKPLINPPYDGSAPCPGCERQLAGRAATIHNFLNRCAISEDSGNIAQGKAWVKLNDLKNFEGEPFELQSDDPVVAEMKAASDALLEALSGLEDQGAKIIWTEDTPAKVNALIPRLAKAVDAWEDLIEAHFDDDRHACGEDNILRERRGSTFPGHHPETKRARGDTSYDHFVRIDPNGQIKHEVCGTSLLIAPYFIERLDRDPDFYGKVWCPCCKLNAPGGQFVRLRRQDADAA